MVKHDPFCHPRFVQDPTEAKAYADYSLTGTIGYGANGTSGGSIADEVNDTNFGNEHSSEWGRGIQDGDLSSFYSKLLDKFIIPKTY
jgi:hypothetical protein